MINYLWLSSTYRSPPYRQGATEPPLLAGQAPPTISPPPDSTTSFGETGIEIELEKLTVGDEVKGMYIVHAIMLFNPLTPVVPRSYLVTP